MTARRFWYSLGAITAIGWLVRVVYIWHWRREPVAVAMSFPNDASYYHFASKLLADGEGFLNPFFTAPGHAYQSADHPPVYQVFLAAFSLVGLDSPNQQLLITATFLGAPTVWVAGLAGRAIRSERVGLLGAALAAISPNVFSWDGMLLSESAAIFFVTCTIWTAYRYRAQPSGRRAALLTAAAALAAMSRAELILLGLLVVLPMVIRHGDRNRRAVIGRLAVGVVVASIIIGPWVAANLVRFEDRVYLSVGAEITMASASGDDTYYGDGTGYWSVFAACDVRAAIRVEHPPEFVVERGVLRRATDEDRSRPFACPNAELLEVPVLDQSEEAPYFRTAATTYIRDHLDRLPVVVVARWGRTLYLWNPAHVVRADSGIEGRTWWVANVGWWTFYPLAMLALGGAVSLRRARVPVYPVAAVFLTVAAAVTLAFGTPRYRASAETALCLLAAVGIDALVTWIRTSRTRRPRTDSPLGGAPSTTSPSSGVSPVA